MNVSQDKLNFCQKKVFLVSKPLDCDFYLSIKEKIEETKHIQIRRGASGRSLVNIPNEISIGAGALITIEDLGFSHQKYDTDKDAYLDAFQQCAAATQFGVLIPVGTIENWKKWAASEACREEVKNVPNDRIFAYIEHQEKDAGGKKGYILRLGKESSAPSIGSGIGYVIWRNGSYYHGELRNGVRNGKGMYVDPSSGDSYDGEWKCDKYHGTGIFVSASVGTYEGKWKNNMYHGKGKLMTESGDVYEGEFKEEHFDGFGKMVCSRGDTYVGEYMKGQYHGKGKYMYENGDTYDGDWMENKYHGKK